jgi:ubiquinone/menaquinone biosynthesis C-methylase UbiE
VPTINYACDSIARVFDLRGDVSSERVERLVRLITSLVVDRPAKLLDIGCGTGRFAIPLAESLEDFTVVGADRSVPMLEEARQKPNADRVLWVKQDINSLSFADSSFDVVFVSDLLHHLECPVDALAECHRILRPGGWLVSKYGALENIICDPEHTFFEGTTEIDTARTPTTEQMENWLHTAGFSSIKSQTEREQTRQSADHRIEAARAKSISVLHLISDSQFEDGLRNLNAYAAKNPGDPWLLVDPTTFTWAQKSTQ